MFVHMQHGNHTTYLQNALTKMNRHKNNKSKYTPTHTHTHTHTHKTHTYIIRALWAIKYLL